MVMGVRDKEEKKRESMIMKAGSKRNLGGDGKLLYPDFGGGSMNLHI